MLPSNWDSASYPTPNAWGNVRDRGKGSREYRQKGGRSRNARVPTSGTVENWRAGCCGNGHVQVRRRADGKGLAEIPPDGFLLAGQQRSQYLASGLSHHGRSGSTQKRSCPCDSSVGFKVLPISTKSRFLLRERPETVGEEQEPPCIYAGEASGN